MNVSCVMCIVSIVYEMWDRCECDKHRYRPSALIEAIRTEDIERMKELMKWTTEDERQTCVRLIMYGDETICLLMRIICCPEEFELRRTVNPRWTECIRCCIAWKNIWLFREIVRTFGDEDRDLLIRLLSYSDYNGSCVSSSIYDVEFFREIVRTFGDEYRVVLIKSMSYNDRYDRCVTNCILKDRIEVFREIVNLFGMDHREELVKTIKHDNRTLNKFLNTKEFCELIPSFK